jgi:hypothetical protein
MAHLVLEHPFGFVGQHHAADGAAINLRRSTDGRIWWRAASNAARRRVADLTSTARLPHGRSLATRRTSQSCPSLARHRSDAIARGRCGSGGPAILISFRSADLSSKKEWRALPAMAALVTLATKAASELSPKAHTISRCPLCLETVTANSPCVGSFRISRINNRCADWALNMLSASVKSGSTATSKCGSGQRANRSLQPHFDIGLTL